MIEIFRYLGLQTFLKYSYFIDRIDVFEELKYTFHIILEHPLLVLDCDSLLCILGGG